MVLHEALAMALWNWRRPPRLCMAVALLNTLAPWAGQGASDTNSDIK
jgi:hypothetical protein